MTTKESTHTTRIPTEASFIEMLFDLTWNTQDADDDNEILALYLLMNTPIGKHLINRAKALRPKFFRTNRAIKVLDVIDTLDAEEYLKDAVADERFGNEPEFYSWKLSYTVVGPHDDETYRVMIEIAHCWERSPRYTKPEQERIRTVRKLLTRELELERYAEKRSLWYQEKIKVASSQSKDPSQANKPPEPRRQPRKDITRPPS